MRAPPAVSEQDCIDAVAIWVPYRIFDKSDREGDIPQGKSPFRFSAKHVQLAAIICFCFRPWHPRRFRLLGKIFLLQRLP